MRNGMFKIGYIHSLLRGRLPGQLVIQMTDKCNARCPQCGMRSTEQFKRTSLRMDEMKRMIDSAAQQGIAFLSFTGGEPLLQLKDLTELIRYAGRAGIPHIRTGSNGFFLRNPEAPDFDFRVKKTIEALSETPLRNFWISVDSAVAEVHEKMRGFDGLVRGMEKALPLFHEAGLYPSANLGLNRNTGGSATAMIYPENFADKDAYLQSFYREFRLALERFYRFVQDLGFSMVNTCYPMSVEEPSETQDLAAVYAASADDRVVQFSDKERALIFQCLLDIVPKFRSSIRIFSPLSSVYALHQQYSGGALHPMPCRGGIDFFFVSAADGNTYPCGYRGQENLGKFWKLNLKDVDCEQDCTACDWECFRDPSELLGPCLAAFTRPLATLRRMQHSGEYRRLWLDDLRYQKACGYFDGRLRPDYAKMARFEDSDQGEAAQALSGGVEEAKQLF